MRASPCIGNYLSMLCSVFRIFLAGDDEDRVLKGRGEGQEIKLMTEEEAHGDKGKNFRGDVTHARKWSKEDEAFDGALRCEMGRDAGSDAVSPSTDVIFVDERVTRRGIENFFGICFERFGGRFSFAQAIATIVHKEKIDPMVPETL